MSYLTQSKLAEDTSILQRATACAALEGIANPAFWVQQHMWELSAQPGWVVAYKYALDSGDDEPGANEGAVTDGMILSAVQLLNQPEEDPEE